jgi:hypothetical protein
MKLTISKQSTLGQIQDEFNAQFPSLKIGFFIDRNKDSILSADEQVKNRHMTIGSIRDIDQDGELSITPETKVSELEEAFSKTFGLEVQVFRKSGTTWLVTTKTDDWTIAEHNQRAKEMANPVEAPEPTDYQEHD